MDEDESTAPGTRLTPIHPSGEAETKTTSLTSALTQPDLATKTADMVDQVVDVVQTKVVKPVELSATYVVLGVFSAFAAIALAVMICVGLFRLLVILLNLIPGSPYVWLAYFILGGIFLGAGVFCMRKRSKITADTPIEATY